MKRIFIGKRGQRIGKTPAILLINPKFAHNVGMVLRLASCYDLSQVWFTGERVNDDLEVRGRLPREERMKGYADVDLINFDYPFEQFNDATPVAVEVREKSENLAAFEHPENPLYVFGPEDGSVPSVLLAHCHRFVTIPTRHCLNLATAVATVLYDRQLKAWLKGFPLLDHPGDFEQRGAL